jgi:hypothetical protein
MSSGRGADIIANCSESELRLVFAQAKGLIEELKNTDIYKKKLPDGDSPVGIVNQNKRPKVRMAKKQVICVL